MGETASLIPVAAMIPEVRSRVAAWRRAGERVGFVPTMGALHEGHLSLVRKAREMADRVVVSVFVNPKQFGPGEDFEAYPRNVETDTRMLAADGCDLLFLPTTEVIYAPGHASHIEISGPARGLEGAHRPGHFTGVATVVAALFGIVRPDLAVFGEKDAQQLAVIRRMTADLHLAVEIVAAPIVREPDGLALSSRNVYLDPQERRAATVLHRALGAAATRIEGGERSADAIRQLLAETLAGEPRARVDYAEVVDAATFQPVTVIAGSLILPLAVKIGQTRLIDNLRVEVS